MDTKKKIYEVVVRCDPTERKCVAADFAWDPDKIEVLYVYKDFQPTDPWFVIPRACVNVVKELGEV